MPLHCSDSARRRGRVYTAPDRIARCLIVNLVEIKQRQIVPLGSTDGVNGINALTNGSGLLFSQFNNYSAEGPDFSYGVSGVPVVVSVPESTSLVLFASGLGILVLVGFFLPGVLTVSDPSS